MSALVTLIASVRTAIDDLPGDKTVFKENLKRSLAGNQVDGTNKDFQFNNKRLIAGTISILVDGVAATVTAPSTANLLKGRVSISSAAPATSALATYDFQFFNDDEITTFLTQATSFIQESGTDPTVVVDGLLDALIYKAASAACFALASRTGMLYNSGAGGKTAEKGDLAKKYRDLSKDLFDRATAERSAYYEGKGGANNPSYGKTNTNQRPYTPRR